MKKMTEKDWDRLGEQMNIFKTECLCLFIFSDKLARFYLMDEKRKDWIFSNPDYWDFKDNVPDKVNPYPHRVSLYLSEVIDIYIFIEKTRSTKLIGG